MDIGN